jgi:hypothetical protein
MTIPTTINYQGYLRDPDGDLTNGAYNITARIYPVAAGGSAVYTTLLQNVTVRDGMFNIVLGDNPALPSSVFANAPLYIGITLNDQSELIPRQRLHAVPWAFQSSTLISNAEIYGFTSQGPITVNGLTTLNGDATLSGAATINGLTTLNNLTVNSAALIKGNETLNGNLFVDQAISTWNESSAAYQTIGVHFLDPILKVTADSMDHNCVKTDWVTYSVAGAIPSDAQAVILEAHGAMGGPDGDVWTGSAAIHIRPSATEGPDLTLLRGSAAAGGDSTSWSGQGFFPLNAAGTSFDYRVVNQPFNAGCYIYLIGYIR